MKRELMYETTTVKGIEELDFLAADFSFTLTRSPQYYRVTEDDCTRLDRLSYLFYQDERYWWVLASVNNIENPLTDLTAGTVLTVPDLLDIYDFFKSQRKR